MTTTIKLTPELKTQLPVLRKFMDETISQFVLSEKEIPAKFSLGLKCIQNLTDGLGVSLAEVNGLADSVGGYFCALKELGELPEETWVEAYNLLMMACNLVEVCRSHGMDLKLIGTEL